MKSDAGQLTAHGKRLVAQSMYAKGKSFLGAALLLRQKKGYEYVVLHLICEGIEITLKGLLLLKDYDKYKSRLKRPFGHNLEKLSKAASTEFGVRLRSATLLAELEKLNSLYSSHMLRYGNFHDVLVSPHTIQGDAVLRKIAAVIRLADRHLFPKSR